MVDSYTKLLLHCDGVDASTTFIDSATGKTVTVVGDAQVDTTQSKFGGASALFDGTLDALTLADHADWFFGTGDFTIDFWMRHNNANIAIWGHATDGNNEHKCFMSGGVLSWANYHSASYQWNIATNGALTANTWYHVALVRYGNTQIIYLDGVAQAATATSAGAVNDYSGLFTIGVHSPYSNYIGHIDEFRISKGIARWTANFTPPSRAYGSPTGGLGFGNPMIF